MEGNLGKLGANRVYEIPFKGGQVDHKVRQFRPSRLHIPGEDTPEEPLDIKIEKEYLKDPFLLKINLTASDNTQTTHLLKVGMGKVNKRTRVRQYECVSTRGSIHGFITFNALRSLLSGNTETITFTNLENTEGLDELEEVEYTAQALAFGKLDDIQDES